LLLGALLKEQGYPKKAKTASVRTNHRFYFNKQE